MAKTLPQAADSTALAALGPLRDSVFLAGEVQTHSSLGVVHERPCVAKPLKILRTDDSFTRDLDAWGEWDLTIDNQNDGYAERIKLWDGTEIESTAALRDHR